MTAVAMIAAALVRLIVVAARLPHERPRAIGLAAVILSTIAVALAVGKASAGFGPGAGLTSRYVTLATPLLSVLYITWLIYGPARRQWAIQGCLLLAVCLSVPGSLESTKDAPEIRLQCFKRVERALRAGRPDSEILDVVCPTLQPMRDWATVWLKMLRSSEFANFKYPQEDRQAAQIAVTATPDTKRR